MSGPKAVPSARSCRWPRPIQTTIPHARRLALSCRATVPKDGYHRDAHPEARRQPGRHAHHAQRQYAHRSFRTRARRRTASPIIASSAARTVTNSAAAGIAGRRTPARNTSRSRSRRPETTRPRKSSSGTRRTDRADRPRDPRGGRLRFTAKQPARPRRLLRFNWKSGCGLSRRSC